MSFSSSVNHLADRLCSSADSAIHSTQSVANRAFDSLSGSVESIRGRAGPMCDKVAAKADAGRHYVSEQPTKSVLIAAAAGATLAAVWILAGRSSRR